nr:serine/threonine/tyrosine-protein kinase HT1-like [Procambarus clarkii]
MELSGEVLSHLLKNRKKILGSGTYGLVVLIEFQGMEAALKVAKSAKATKSFTREAKILESLKGAGGAPLLLGVSTEPQALLTTYKGNCTLENLLKNPLYNLITVGLEVGRKIQEIHAMGIIHNDIKVNNVMIQGSPNDPKVSIIDYGLACKDGDNMLMAGDPSVYKTYAPEFLRRQPSTQISDVFSYGRLMQELLQNFHTRYPPLDYLFMRATHPNPVCRPTLPDILQRLQDFVVSNALNQVQPHNEASKRLTDTDQPCSGPNKKVAVGGPGQRLPRQNKRLADKDRFKWMRLAPPLIQQTRK